MGKQWKEWTGNPGKPLLNAPMRLLPHGTEFCTQIGTQMKYIYTHCCCEESLSGRRVRSYQGRFQQLQNIRRVLQAGMGSNEPLHWSSLNVLIPSPFTPSVKFLNCRVPSNVAQSCTYFHIKFHDHPEGMSQFLRCSFQRVSVCIFAYMQYKYMTTVCKYTQLHTQYCL